MNGPRGCSASRRVVYAARAMPRRISNLRFSDAACCFSAQRRTSISSRSVGTSLQAHSACQNANDTSVARAQLCSGGLSTCIWQPTGQSFTESSRQNLNYPPLRATSVLRRARPSGRLDEAATRAAQMKLIVSAWRRRRAKRLNKFTGGYKHLHFSNQKP